MKNKHEVIMTLIEELSKYDIEKTIEINKLYSKVIENELKNNPSPF